MIEHLSDDWFTACNDALATAGAAPVDAPLRIGQVIEGTQPVSWTTVLGVVSSIESGVDEVDVCFHQTATTAAAIASGTTTMHEQFMLGQVRLSGNSRALTANAAATAWLDKVLADVRAQTSYPH